MLCLTTGNCTSLILTLFIVPSLFSTPRDYMAPLLDCERVLSTRIFTKFTAHMHICRHINHLMVENQSTRSDPIRT